MGPTEVKVLNRLLSRVVSPGTIDVDAVGWKGIADATVGFQRLRTALGLTVGSVDGALDATITYRQLLNATVDALNADGTASSLAAATPLAQIAAQVDPSMGATFSLRDLFDIAGTVGDGQDVADARLGVLDIVRGGAILADGDHFASIDLTAAEVGAIPGFNFARVKFGLIEAPQMRSGPPGKDAGGVYLTTAETSHIRLLVEVNLKLLLTGIGLTDVKVPYYLEAGSARAHLDALRCLSSSTPDRVDVLAVTEAGSSRLGTVSDTALASQVTAPAPGPTRVVDVAGLVTVDTTTVLNATVAGNAGTMLSFYPPYTAESASQQVAANSITLPSLAASNLTVTALVLGLNTGAIATDVATGTNDAVPGVRGEILAPVYRALGLSFAGADVWAPPPQDCGSSLVNPNAAPNAYSVPTLVG